MADPDELEAGRHSLLHSPVTSLIALSWIALFLVLATAREGPLRIPTLLFGGFIPSTVSHGFGDVTPLGLYGGQFWRAETATFIHFNLLHLLLNLVAFVQLGRVVESWYGSWQFLAIYAILGAGANVAANLLRPWVAGPSGLIVHSGGGSTVVLGLIGLVAVVGWRNPSEFPKRAPLWMAAILLANAILGMVVPNIDNLGHAAGAFVGGLVGLFDRRLIRQARTGRAIALGLIGLAALAGSAAAQADHRSRERVAADRVARLGASVEALTRINLGYRELAARGLRPVLLFTPKPANLPGRPPLAVPEHPDVAEAIRRDLLAALRGLDSPPEGPAPDAESLRTLRRLASRTWFKPPTADEFAEFSEAFVAVSRPTFVAWAEAGRELGRLQRPDPRFAGAALSRLARPSAPPRADAEGAPAAASTPRRTPPSTGSAPGTP